MQHGGFIFTFDNARRLLLLAGLIPRLLDEPRRTLDGVSRLFFVPFPLILLADPGFLGLGLLLRRLRSTQGVAWLERGHGCTRERGGEVGRGLWLLRPQDLFVGAGGGFLLHFYNNYKITLVCK